MKLYSFKMSGGDVKIMGLQEASKLLSDPVIKSRFEEILMNSKNVKKIRDGFVSGWQENIQAHAGGPQEYAQLLKEKGLVEIGRDYVPQESTGNDLNFCHTEEFIESCIEQGVELNEKERDAIKTGEFYKDIQVE